MAPLHRGKAEMKRLLSGCAPRCKGKAPGIRVARELQAQLALRVAFARWQEGASGWPNLPALLFGRRGVFMVV